MVFLCSGDFSNLQDEGRFNAAVEALNTGEAASIRIFTIAFSHLLRIYTSNQDWKEGRSLHHLARICGLDSDPFLGTRLVRMYSIFECLPEAREAFQRISEPNVFAWHAYMSAFLRTGFPRQVMSLYRQMQSLGVPPNEFVFVSVLKACCSEEELMDIHSHVINVGLETEDFVGSMLIDKYVRYGRLDEALAVFHGMSTSNVVAWSTLLAGYVQQRQPEVALHMFIKMQQSGLQPNQFTFVGLLKACSLVEAGEVGRLVHSQILESGFEMETIVGSALVDMYARNGNLDDARAVLYKMKRLDVVAWSALISGCAQHGCHQQALENFWEGLKQGMMPDNVAFSTVLLICPLVAAFEQALITYMRAIEGGFAGDLFVGSALVSLYAQCGNLKDACIVFEQLHNRSVWTWCAIIAGCAQHSNFSLSRKYFEDMQRDGIQPNSLAFHALLSACNHEGLLKEAFHHFKLMQEHDNIAMPEHFHTMVDLLGRMGYLDEAEDLLEMLHFQSDVEGWRTLLWTSYRQGIVGLGRRCFDRLSSFGAAADKDYVMMSSIYARACDDSEAGKIEEMRKAVGLPREVPTAYIEIEKQVHAFSSGDLVHPQKEKIQAKLRCLGIGEYYASELKCSGLYRDNEAWEGEALCGHVERVAVAFGLVNSSPDTVLRISKTFWMCASCHNAMKRVSKMEGREIVVFVGNRVHCFHEGACICKDKLYL